MTISVLLVILYRAFFWFARGAGKNSLINLFHIAQMSLYFLCGQQNNRLNVHSHPKLVHAPDLPDLISTIAEELQVSGKGGGVAADVYDAFGLHAEHSV